MGIWKIILLFMMLVSPLAAAVNGCTFNTDIHEGGNWSQFERSHLQTLKLIGWRYRPTKVKLKEYIGKVRVSLNALQNDDVDENVKLQIKSVVESVVQWMEKNPNATSNQYAEKQAELMRLVHVSKNFRAVLSLDFLISFSKHHMKDCEEFDPLLREEIERKLDAVEEWVYSHGYKIKIDDTLKAYEEWLANPNRNYEADIDDAYVQKYREVDILTDPVFDHFVYFHEKLGRDYKVSTNSILF